LAPLCQTVVAVDFSEIALERARQRRRWGDRVTFRPWNLRTDPVPRKFDLIVIMDVLGYIRRPGRLRKVNDKLVSSMRRGDLLFACEFREADLYEDSWLAKRLRLGGECIIQELAAHPGLETVKAANTESHVFALLRKL
jgi:predicted TPR repeat methyltransferase